MWVRYAELACWAAIALSNIAIAIAQFKRVSPRREMIVNLSPVKQKSDSDRGWIPQRGDVKK